MPLVRFLVVLCTLLAVFAPAADAAYCGSQSSVSRRCFFSVYKVCLDKGLKKSFCRKRSAACGVCADKIAKCRIALKSNKQCGKCTKTYDACMRPVFRGITKFE